MSNVILGVILLLCVVGTVGTAFAAVKRNSGMFDKVYARLVDVFTCFFIGTIFFAAVAAFVLILGG